MSSSLNIGTTGLSASEKQMDVIGNNLANANTVGFKAADTYFASMLSQSLSGGGGASSVGQGVGVAAVTTVFSQGTFESTGNVTDVAIDGNGFFIAKDKDGNSLYTRAGGFHIANDGMLNDINKYSVQGHMYDSDGVAELQTLASLNLQNALSKPSTTSYFDVGMTLDSQTPVGSTFNSSQVVYDSRGAKHNLNTTFTKMEDSAYWAVSTTLSDTQNGKDVAIPAFNQTYSGLKFDANGGTSKVYSSDFATGDPQTTSAAGTFTSKTNNAGNLYKDTTATSKIVLTNVDATHWNIASADYPNATATVAADGTLGVDLDGVDGQGAPDITFSLGGTWKNDGTETIKFDIATKEIDPANSKISFYDTTDPKAGLADGSTIGTDGYLTWNLAGLPDHAAPAIKTFATTSRIASLENDGYAPGILTSLVIDKDGLVEGMFSNGQRQKLARILLADFANLQGLNKVGSYFIETADSGPPVNNKPGSGGLGELQSNSLEMSNTDTAKEFIKMITAQRAYQSSAKIIATADQMLQTLMNVKQ